MYKIGNSDKFSIRAANYSVEQNITVTLNFVQLFIQTELLNCSEKTGNYKMFMAPHLCVGTHLIRV
jgi:hypothetical protein